MSCPLSVEIHSWVQDRLLNQETLAWLTSAGTSFAVIAAAEIGDKSQLVCMTLAARHRHWPVFLGAFSAFALLNLIAVLFGAAVVQWVPRLWITLSVAALFAVFGVMALLARPQTHQEHLKEMSGHGVFLTTFLMIFLAEFGDKTQLATAGLSTTAESLPVWVGSTLALGLSSALGVGAGRTVLQRIPLRLLHGISGLLFLGLAGFVMWQSGELPQPSAWLGVLKELWQSFIAAAGH